MRINRMPPIKLVRFVLVVCLTAAVIHADEESNDRMLADRGKLVEIFERGGPDTVAALSEAVDDERFVVSLTALNLLARLGESGEPGIVKGLDHPDPKARCAAIEWLANNDALTDHWGVILLDEDPMIKRLVRTRLLNQYPFPKGEALDRLLAALAKSYVGASTARREYTVHLLSLFKPLPALARLALIAATLDPDPQVRASAYEGILKHIDRGWLNAETLLKRAEEDKAKVVRDVGLETRWKLLQEGEKRLPGTGWRFKLDPDGGGREQGWFKTDFDDGGWREDIPIESSWQDHLDEIYFGPAWYRIDFEAPKPEKWDAAFLDFKGVDEEAWVWLNGQFVGKHAVGPEGWNEPFLLNVTGAVKPGQTNQLTILAKNTAGGGGVWAPVQLRMIDTTVFDKEVK